MVADCGVVEVALNAVTLYSTDPLAGLPTSERGILSVITPVLAS